MKPSIVTIIFLLFVPPMFALAVNFEGLQVFSVEFKAEGFDLSEMWFPDLKTRPGEKFSRKNLNYDLQTLYATGNFVNITVTGRKNSEGKLIVVFRVKLTLFIKSIKFEGQTGFSSDVLEEQINILYMTPLEKGLPERARRQLRHFYSSEGYFNPSIDWRFDKDADSRFGDLVFVINSGREAFIRNLFLEGNFEGNALRQKDILKKLKMEELSGSRYSVENINEWIASLLEKLWQRGYFTTYLDFVDTEYDSENNTVDATIRVITDGRIFLGLMGSGLFREQFIKIMQESPKRSLSGDLLKEWRSRVEDHYAVQGYRDVKVFSETEHLVGEDPIFGKNNKRVKLLVRKGKKHVVSHIVFSGNVGIHSADLLKTLVSPVDLDKRKVIFTGNLIDEMIDRLTNYYHSKGYLDAEIESSNIEYQEIKDVKTARFNFNVKEGLQFKVSQLEINSVPHLPFVASEILEQLNLQVGSVYTRALLDSSMNEIRNFLDSRGYSDIEVDSNVYKDRDGGIHVDVFLQFREKPRITRIVLNGNFKTDSSFLLGKLTFKKGDSLSRRALLENQLKIYDLGIFSRVEFADLVADMHGSQSRVVLKVQESHSILMTYGAGIDTENLLYGTFGISHNNIRGKGRKANLRFSIGGREKLAQIGYQDPSFIGEKWGLFASLLYEEQTRESFGLIRRAGIIQLNRRLTPHISNYISFNLENIDLFDVRISELLIPPEDRAVNLTSVSTTFVIDLRDSPFNPSEGMFISGNLKWATKFLGSDEGFLKGYFQSNFYVPLVGDSLLAFGYRLGLAFVFDENKNLPPSERFFAGGSNSLRAYPIDLVGPVALDENGNYLPLGGNALMLINAEFRVPVFGDLGFVLFWDSGSAFESPDKVALSKFSHSVGFGLRYNTPVGPLRIDWGFNPENFDENQIYLSIGHAF